MCAAAAISYLIPNDTSGKLGRVSPLFPFLYDNFINLVNGEGGRLPNYREGVVVVTLEEEKEEKGGIGDWGRGVPKKLVKKVVRVSTFSPQT